MALLLPKSVVTAEKKSADSGTFMHACPPLSPHNRHVYYHTHIHTHTHARAHTHTYAYPHTHRTALRCAADPRGFYTQSPQPPPAHSVALSHSLIYKMSSATFSRPLLEPMASAWRESEVGTDPDECVLLTFVVPIALFGVELDHTFLSRLVHEALPLYLPHELAAFTTSSDCSVSSGTARLPTIHCPNSAHYYYTELGVSCTQSLLPCLHSHSGHVTVPISALLVVCCFGCNTGLQRCTLDLPRGSWTSCVPCPGD